MTTKPSAAQRFAEWQWVVVVVAVVAVAEVVGRAASLAEAVTRPTPPRQRQRPPR